MDDMEGGGGGGGGLLRFYYCAVPRLHLNFILYRIRFLMLFLQSMLCYRCISILHHVCTSIIYSHHV